ncbi:MAG: hypothetical protein EXR71_00490 [Myxococcales bacterium]|nr:hypothetical protein [Myxococcales bacterium]
MLLLLATFAAAAPSFGVFVGGGVIGGETGRGEYLSGSPMLGGTMDWRFAYVETWLGLSASGFVAPYRGGDVPAALLQGEVGLGFGNPNASGGVYVGAGVSGGEGGLYARALFPGPRWAPRLGGEVRAFHLGTTDSSGAVFLLRAEFGGKRGVGRPAPPPREPPPPPPPVHHDDPYG